MANSVDPDQTAPIGAVCSGSTLFASTLNSSVMLGNYLQQTTSADDIFRYIFSWRFNGQSANHNKCFLIGTFKASLLQNLVSVIVGEMAGNILLE